MDILGVVGSPAPGTFNYYFPNDQSARLVFYHDRAPDCCGGANRCEGSAPAAEAAARGSGAPRTTWRHDSSAWHSGERPDAQRGLRQFGRLIQRLGTTQPLYEGTFARNYEDTPTEMPVAGAVEAWRIFNLSAIRIPSTSIWSTCRSSHARRSMSDVCAFLARRGLPTRTSVAGRKPSG